MAAPLRRRHDLIVVGGGAAGLVASREAHRRGASVALVSDGPPGGDCTFTGCIPSKTLLAAAAAGETFGEAMARIERTVERIAATEDAVALRRDGIDVIDGRARFIRPDQLAVTTADGEMRLRSRRVVLATGASPAMPDVSGLADVGPLTNETVFRPRPRPRSMLVLGGGPMGCEIAQAMARLGVRVTLVEAADRVLPREEPDASAVIADALVGDGVEILVNHRMARAARLDTDARDAADGRVRVELMRGTAQVGATRSVEVETGCERIVDEVLVATGRTPTTAGMGLEEIGVALDRRGAVVVDAQMRTSHPGIYAAGDVTGLAGLTHAAGRMGWVAASNALWPPARLRGFHFDTTSTPQVVFTSPELGRVGLIEAEAAQRYPTARVAHLPLAEVDRAIAAGDERGFVRLIAAPRRGLSHLAGGRLVGATVVAPTGGELIHGAALAIQTRMFTGRLVQTGPAYPTWSFAVQQAALQFFGTSAGRRARAVRRG